MLWKRSYKISRTHCKKYATIRNSCMYALSGCAPPRFSCVPMQLQYMSEYVCECALKCLHLSFACQQCPFANANSAFPLSSCSLLVLGCFSPCTCHVPTQVTILERLYADKVSRTHLIPITRQSSKQPTSGECAPDTVLAHGSTSHAYTFVCHRGGGERMCVSLPKGMFSIYTAKYLTMVYRSTVRDS